jgi:AraC family transcriptional regulator
MSERTAAGAYAERLERVFAWLADHLDDRLDLVRLADVACLSPYHFHRVYRAVQGETVMDTVRRLRLHRAAVELIAGSMPVPRVARRAGYGSQEAFTRAFKAAYGVPPGRYRASFAPLPRTSGTEAAMTTTTDYQVTIRDQRPIRVAALPHRGDYQAIGATFERLTAIAAGQGVFGPRTRTFGIYYGDPKGTPQDELRADACMTVPDSWTPAGGLELREIRGGRYAVLRHVGPYAELERSYSWLYGTWLPQSGEEPAHAPVIEEYLNDARMVPAPELETDIYLPLA